MSDDILSPQNVQEIEAFALRCRQKPHEPDTRCRSCNFILRLVKHIRATSNQVLTESVTR